MFFYISKELVNQMLYPCFNILLKSLHLLSGLDGIDFPENCHQDGKALNSFAPEAKILLQIPDCQVEAQVVFQGGEFPFTGFDFWIFESFPFLMFCSMMCSKVRNSF